MDEKFQGNYFLPVIRHLSSKRKRELIEYKNIKNLNVGRIVDIRPENVDFVRRTPSPMAGLSPMVCTNRVLPISSERKMLKLDLSNVRTKSRIKDNISICTSTTKKNNLPPKLICIYQKVKSKSNRRSKISINPSPSSRQSDFSCQINF